MLKDTLIGRYRHSFLKNSKINLKIVQCIYVYTL